MKREMEENGKGNEDEKKEFSFWQVVFLVFADSRMWYVSRKTRGLSKGKGVKMGVNLGVNLGVSGWRRGN